MNINSYCSVWLWFGQPRFQSWWGRIFVFAATCIAAFGPLARCTSNNNTGKLNGDGWHNQICPFIEEILK
jgi:hypothetical protein